jgi:peptidyl-prolyl cis-trans isomerase C
MPLSIRPRCERPGLGLALGRAALLLGLVMAACARPTTVAPSPEPTLPGVEAPSLEPSLSPPPAPPTDTPAPTATPEPLAVTVNGQDIGLAAYERELARCQAGLAAVELDTSGCPEAVMQSLVEQAVMEQAAQAAGLAVSEAEVDQALADILSDLGGQPALDAWLQANLYSADEFRAALQAEALRARLLERIAAQVGDSAEQVHARAILVTDAETAATVLAQAQAGTDFATLALTFSRDLTSRAAGGDLGWFPRGVLTVPEVEAAAFALEPGQTSEVITSGLGYHIVQVLERDPARALSPAAAQTLRVAAVHDWLDARLAEADVTRHLNP